jgi:hypothetical protein
VAGIPTRKCVPAAYPTPLKSPDHLLSFKLASDKLCNNEIQWHLNNSIMAFSMSLSLPSQWQQFSPQVEHACPQKLGTELSFNFGFTFPDWCSDLPSAWTCGSIWQPNVDQALSSITAANSSAIGIGSAQLVLLRCVNETEQMAAGMTIIWFSHILFPTSLIAILSIPSNCNSHFTLSKHNLWANHSLIVPELRRPVKQICHTTTSPACRTYNNSGSS